MKLKQRILCIAVMQSSMVFAHQQPIEVLMKRAMNYFQNIQKQSLLCKSDQQLAFEKNKNDFEKILIILHAQARQTNKKIERSAKSRREHIRKQAQMYVPNKAILNAQIQTVQEHIQILNALIETQE